MVRPATFTEWQKRYGTLTEEDMDIMDNLLARMHPRAHEAKYVATWGNAARDYFNSGRGWKPEYRYGEARAVVTCQVRALW